MSRSFKAAAGRRALPLAWAAVAYALALGGLAAEQAMAGPNPSPGPGTRTTHRAPVLPIVAPVLDIRTPTSDLQGYATVEHATGRARIRLDSTLLFGRDSARLRTGARRRIAEVARTMSARGPGQITVTGYTDDLGSAAHGRRLSRRRATAVADVFRDTLPDGYTYRVSGRGEANPAVPNTSETNRKKNRRVLVSYRRW